MLPLLRLGGAHLSRIAAYMELALHEMPGGYALLKSSDAFSCVISLISIFFGKRFSKLTLFMQIPLSISNLFHANPTFIKVAHYGWGQHPCRDEDKVREETFDAQLKLMLNVIKHG